MIPLENAPTMATEEQLRFDVRTSLDVNVQTMEAILDIMTTLGRVGAKIVAINASGVRVRIVYDASAFVARRLPSLLETIIQVEAVKILERAESWLDQSEMPLEDTIR